MSGPGSPARQVWWLRSRTWAAVWAVWFSVLFVLSSLSSPGPRINLDHFDKVGHAVWFAGGGICFALAVALRGRSAREAVHSADWRRIALLTLLAGALTGAFDEWHQWFTPGRSALDPWDWLADCSGSLVAGITARPFLRWLASRTGAS